MSGQSIVIFIYIYIYMSFLINWATQRATFDDSTADGTKFSTTTDDRDIWCQLFQSSAAIFAAEATKANSIVMIWIYRWVSSHQNLSEGWNDSSSSPNSVMDHDEWSWGMKWREGEMRKLGRKDKKIPLTRIQLSRLTNHLISGPNWN